MFALVKLGMSGKFDEFYDKVKSNDNLEYRVKTALEYLEYALPLEIQCECKDSHVSHNLRRKADELFFDNRESVKGHMLALEIYSKSVAYAENNSRALSLAYANRSAILCNLHKFKECIEDIDRALNFNNPNTLKANLLRRKAKCLKILEHSEAENIGKEATECLKNINLCSKNKGKFVGKIQNNIDLSEGQGLKNKTTVTFAENFEQNKNIPCASEAINLKYNKNYRRHIIAARDIKAGEILAIEKPYGMLLKPECLYTHCSQCFKRAWSSIPCPNCVYAMYCSEKCKNKAWEQYHDIECFVKGYLSSLNMNDLAPFSLKIAILAIREAGGFDKLKRQLQEIDKYKDPLRRNFSEDGIYHSDTYRALYCAETHEKERTMHEIVPVTINSALIVYFLYNVTTLFGDNSDKNYKILLENKDAIFLARLIGHHYMSIQLNDHEITEHDHSGTGVGLGAAVFSFCSLFSHNCNPNATRVPVLGEDGEIQLVIVAQYPIKEGSQVYDDYGFDFSITTRSQRDKICQSYYFTCGCRACKNDWPLLEDLPSILSTPISEEKRTELEKILDNIARYEKLISRGKLKNMDPCRKKVLTELANSTTILYNHTSDPTIELIRTVSFLRQAFILIYGHRINL